MVLKKFTADLIADKDIYCYKKSVSYLSELAKKYDGIAGNIKGIFDDSEKNQGKFEWQGRIIDVMSVSEICNMSEIDWNDSILLILDDYFEEAFDRVRLIFEEGSVRDASFLCPETIYFFQNHETEYEFEFKDLYKDRALENIIVFRSGPHASSYVKGMDFSDNARAVFEYMLSNNLNQKYELVWFVKNPAEYKEYDTVYNVSFVAWDYSVSDDKCKREQYYRPLCLAKYIFFTDAYGFARNCRKDQLRVQLWHGCGYKTRVNFSRCEKRYEYTTVISDLYADIHADVYGLRKDQILVTGYAKQDWLFESDCSKLDRLGIPKASKYIFWLPTFRSTESKLQELNQYELQSDTGLPIVKNLDMLKAVNLILCESDIIMIIKLHPFQNRSQIHCDELSNIVVLENENLISHDIQINQVLGCADALISDYSSAAVDFMLLDRPIAFTLDDVEEYEQSRGFVFDNIRDWLPGKEIWNMDDLFAFIYMIAEGKDFDADKRHDLLAKMHKYHDGNSCQRIVETLNIGK